MNGRNLNDVIDVYRCFVRKKKTKVLFATYLPKIAVIFLKRGQKASFLRPISPKITLGKKKERKNREIVSG